MPVPMTRRQSLMKSLGVTLLIRAERFGPGILHILTASRMILERSFTAFLPSRSTPPMAIFTTSSAPKRVLSSPIFIKALHTSSSACSPVSLPCFMSLL